MNSFASQMHSSTIVIAEKFGVVGVIKKETKSLSLLDISDLSVIQHFSLDDAPTSVAYDESVEAFYVASSSNSSLLVISARTFKKIAILQLDRDSSRNFNNRRLLNSFKFNIWNRFFL